MSKLYKEEKNCGFVLAIIGFSSFARIATRLRFAACDIAEKHTAEVTCGVPLFRKERERMGHPAVSPSSIGSFFLLARGLKLRPRVFRSLKEAACVENAF